MARKKSAIKPARLADQVYKACKAEFSALISAHPDQHFYAFALWTDDSLQFLHPAANTEEALTATVRRYREEVDPRYGNISTRAGMRWSYGDWGFFGYQDGGHFNEVSQVLNSNWDMMVADDQFDGRVDALFDALLDGFRRLESEKFFETGLSRSKITLMLVGDLPWELISSWVRALNPKDISDQFLSWDADAPCPSGRRA
jgi:hypothetical protein